MQTKEEILRKNREYSQRPKNKARAKAIQQRPETKRRRNAINRDNYQSPKAEAYRKKNEEELKAKGRKQHLKKKFGLTIEEYNKLLKKQNGVCVICGKKEIVKWKGILKSLAVDHNHKTGKVRGLLCYKCNIGIGFFQEDILILKKAIEYLEELKADR